MIDTIIFGIPASAVVLALTGIVKQFIKDNRWYPIISIIFGIFVSWGSGGFHFSWSMILGGVILGLVASGLFDTGKGIIKLGKEKIKK